MLHIVKSKWFLGKQNDKKLKFEIKQRKEVNFFILSLGMSQRKFSDSYVAIFQPQVDDFLKDVHFALQY